MEVLLLVLVLLNVEGLLMFTRYVLQGTRITVKGTHPPWLTKWHTHYQMCINSIYCLPTSNNNRSVAVYSSSNDSSKVDLSKHHVHTSPLDWTRSSRTNFIVDLVPRWQLTETYTRAWRCRSVQLDLTRLQSKANTQTPDNKWTRKQLTWRESNNLRVACLCEIYVNYVFKHSLTLLVFK